MNKTVKISDYYYRKKKNENNEDEVDENISELLDEIAEALSPKEE